METPNGEKSDYLFDALPTKALKLRLTEFSHIQSNSALFNTFCKAGMFTENQASESTTHAQKKTLMHC
jgi:hypothetical protein